MSIKWSGYWTAPFSIFKSIWKTFSQFVPLGPSLEEKLFSSCDFTAEKVAQVHFKSRPSLDRMGPKTKVSVQFQTSNKSRNWALASEDLSSVFVIPRAPASAAIIRSAAADSSPQTSSDSGETSAFFFSDWIAAPSLSLWYNSNNRCSNFLCAWGEMFSLPSSDYSFISFSSVFPSRTSCYLNKPRWHFLLQKSTCWSFDSAHLYLNMFDRPSHGGAHRTPFFFPKNNNKSCLLQSSCLCILGLQLLILCLCIPSS